MSRRVHGRRAENVDYKEFGQQLTRARKARGLSRLEVAISICVDPSFYARVERGVRMVSLMTFALLWRDLALDAGRLLDTLPVDVREPSKRESRGPLSRAELAGPLAGFDKLLARARIDAGLTQEALAGAVGASRRQIARIECGHALPSVPRFAQLRRVLGFNPDRVIARLLGEDIPIEPFHGFGAEIKAARLVLSMAIARAAEASECELDRYKRIERGVFLPTMREVVLIHRAVQFDANAALRWVWETGALDDDGNSSTG